MCLTRKSAIPYSGSACHALMYCSLASTSGRSFTLAWASRILCTACKYSELWVSWVTTVNLNLYVESKQTSPTTFTEQNVFECIYKCKWKEGFNEWIVNIVNLCTQSGMGKQFINSSLKVVCILPVKKCQQKSTKRFPYFNSNTGSNKLTLPYLTPSKKKLVQ